MRAQRATLDAAVVRLAGRRLVAGLAALAAYRDAPVVLAYIGVDNEVPTEDVLEDALRHGKRVYLPKVCEAWFAEYAAGTPLVASATRVPEPTGEAFPGGVEGIVLVPLLAWTAAGDRLGRGGGWYDRVLPRLRLPAVGVGYDFQQRAHVPTEPSDVRLDYVVTESRLLDCGGVRSEGRLSW